MEKEYRILITKHKWYHTLIDHVRAAIRFNRKGIEHVAILNFVVDKNGRVGNVLQGLVAPIYPHKQNASHLKYTCKSCVYFDEATSACQSADASVPEEFWDFRDDAPGWCPVNQGSFEDQPMLFKDLDEYIEEDQDSNEHVH